MPPTLVSEVACQISSKLLLLPKSNRLEYLSDKVYESNDDNFQFQPVIQFQFIFISCLVSNKVQQIVCGEGLMIEHNDAWFEAFKD